jgi:hypothetical protein
MISLRPTSANLLWLVLGAVCFASMAFYTTRVWSANQPENFSDLYARWWGAHELLLHGRNPYSPAVSHEIQTVIYGKAVNPSPDDPMGIGGGFAYPPYTVLLLWPTIYGSFAHAAGMILFVSISLTLLSISLWLRTLRISVSPWHWTTLALFVFGSFPVLQGLKLLNLSLIAAAFIALGVFLLSADHPIWAGVFLAAATFKPQFVILLLPWLALWSLADWRVRWRLAVSFLMTMLLLLLVSELLLPSGLFDFLAVARAYRHYTYGHSVLDVWFTPRFGPVACAALLFIVMKLTWRTLAAAANTAGFVGAVSFLLATTVVVIPTLAPHVQLLLLPGLIYLVESRESIWNSGPPGRLLLTGTGALLAWPWVAALGLVAASFRQPIGSLLRFWEVPLYTSMILPLAVFLALAWQLRPQVPGEAAPNK